ncbi:MAG: AraC family transcriptional regulator [Firmicutes bacterium]|nr:AraC family transcriptional regulator [Bacillota bacterium]
MAQILDYSSVWHEVVEEVDHLPVYFSSPGRNAGCTQGHCHRTDDLTIPAHWHEYVEFLWLREGRMTAVVQADTYELAPGDLLTINSGELHMTKISSRTAYCPYVLIQVSFQRLREYLPNLERLRFTTCLRKAEIDETPGLSQALCAMQQLFEENADGYQLLFTARFFEFLHSMYRHHAALALPEAENATVRDLNRVMEVVGWTQAHYQQPLSLDDAAAHIGISKEYFCRIFKKYTGQTYLDYLCMIRTTHFYDALQTSDESIPALMERSGLTNYKTFLRTFRALYGTTPQKARLHAQ